MADETLSEEWRPIEGWPYEVSNLGRVRRSADAHNGRGVVSPKGRIIGSLDDRGYFEVRLSHAGLKGRSNIARLVCRAFHGPAPSPKHYLVAHWDGNPANDRSDNLRWATAAENAADMVRHGTSRRGEKSNFARLTEREVRIIRERLAAGESCSKVAADYLIDSSTVWQIKAGRTWRHIT